MERPTMTAQANRSPTAGDDAIGLSRSSRLGALAAHLATWCETCADYYEAAALYEELSVLSDAELERRGLSRATLARYVSTACDGNRTVSGSLSLSNARAGDPHLVTCESSKTVPPTTAVLMAKSDHPTHRQATMVLPASPGVRAMKTIVSVFVALSVLAGIAGSASALDPKTFYEQQDRQSY
jgi:hypothetical protein